MSNTWPPTRGCSNGGISNAYSEAAGLWSRIDSLTSVGPYDMRGVLRFLDHVPDRDRARAAADRLGPAILSVVALEPGASGEVMTPLHLAPSPESVARDLFDGRVI